MSAGDPKAVSVNANPPTPSLGQTLQAVGELARHVEELHQQGQLHLGIHQGAITRDSNGQLVLAPPKESAEFGGADFDAELCPLALQTPQVVGVPTKLAEAGQVLEGRKLSLAPEAIDLYQLGTLLCRLVTGQSIAAYLRSPKVKSQVPPEVQDLIDTALGQNHDQTFRNLTEFAEALLNVKASQSAATGDTAPSVLSPQPESDTSVITKRDKSAHAEGALPFSHLGHFEILEHIGQGGMGDVYKGYERSLDRTVAIKVLPTEFSRSQDFVRRFYSEATAAARLVHPNIIQIYYIGEDQNHHFFAMQYIEGETLADRLATMGKLSLAKTLAIIEQSLAGLSAAHEMGLVHRDIKPGNILIDAKTERAYLADFGLVKSLQQSEGMTATGMVMGTVDYISPEQGRGLAVDARADLYSLGVVVYRMLSGKLPFQADSPTAMIFQHVYETPPPLAKECPTLPAIYSRIVEKMLAKNPEERYESAQAILDDLNAAQAGQPLPSGVDTLPFEEPPSVSPADSFAPSPKDTHTPTQIIHAPRLEELSGGVDDWNEPSPGWWQRVKNYGKGVLSKKTPDLYESLQSTQQLMDGAVEEYEQRQHTLKELRREAESVLKGLTEQVREWERVAHNTQNPSEQDRCQRMLSELQDQAKQQGEELERIRQQHGRVKGKLQQLRSQRDVLKARMKVAKARITASGGRVQERSFAHRLQEYVRQHPWQTISPAVMVLSLLIMALIATSRPTPDPEPGAKEIAPTESRPIAEPTGDPVPKEVMPVAMERTDDSVTVAGIRVRHDIPIERLETGAWTTLGSNDRMVFTNVPPELAGHYFTKRPAHQGRLQFDVLQAQKVYLAVFGGEWGGGGGAGEWQKRIMSRDVLEKQGWTEILRLPTARRSNSDSQPWPASIVFARDCRVGERWSIQTHKYDAPILIWGKAPPMQTAPPSPPVSSTGNVLLCRELNAGDASPQLLVEGMPFTAPAGDGRSGAVGFTVPSRDLMTAGETVLSFTFRTADPKKGLFQIIHPYGEGHVLITVHTGITLHRGGSWGKIGWGDPRTSDEIKTSNSWRSIFPLKANVPYQVVSQLTPAGIYRLQINKLVVCQAVIKSVEPLVLEIPNDGKFYQSSSWKKKPFEGPDFNPNLPAGAAGVIVGPADNTTNSCRNIVLSNRVSAYPLQGSTQSPKPAPPLEVDNPNLQRKVAEWCIDLGGYVHLTSLKDGRTFGTNRLPKDEFYITSVRLEKTGRPTLEEMNLLLSVPTLESLVLRSCNLHDEDLQPITNRPQMIMLDLRGNPLTDDIGPYLEILTELEGLVLDETQVTDEVLTHIRSGDKISDLRLSDTQITDKGVETLQNFTKLRTLTLDGTKITDKSIPRIRTLPLLASLYLEETQISDEALKMLIGHRQLANISLAKTDITDAGLTYLAQMPKLWVLNLEGCSVTNQGLVDRLLKIPHLATLNLENTPLTDAGLEALGKHPRLNRLNIEGTEVTPEGKAKFLKTHPNMVFISKMSR